MLRRFQPSAAAAAASATNVLSRFEQKTTEATRTTNIQARRTDERTKMRRHKFPMSPDKEPVWRVFYTALNRLKARAALRVAVRTLARGMQPFSFIRGTPSKSYCQTDMPFMACYGRPPAVLLLLLLLQLLLSKATRQTLLCMSSEHCTAKLRALHVIAPQPPHPPSHTHLLLLIINVPAPFAAPRLSVSLEEFQFIAFPLIIAIVPNNRRHKRHPPIAEPVWRWSNGADHRPRGGRRRPLAGIRTLTFPPVKNTCC